MVNETTPFDFQFTRKWNSKSNGKQHFVTRRYVFDPGRGFQIFNAERGRFVAFDERSFDVYDRRRFTRFVFGQLRKRGYEQTVKELEAMKRLVVRLSTGESIALLARLRQALALGEKWRSWSDLEASLSKELGFRISRNNVRRIVVLSGSDVDKLLLVKRKDVISKNIVPRKKYEEVVKELEWLREEIRKQYPLLYKRLAEAGAVPAES